MRGDQMKLKSNEEYIKYITERAVEFIETPRRERKQQRSIHHEKWTSRWFGMIPFAIGFWMKNRLDKK